MKDYRAYEMQNPCRSPEWRWDRVRHLAEHFPSPARCSSRDDAWVRGARQLLVIWPEADEATREHMLWANPGLVLAYQAYERRREGDALPAFFMEARLLAGQAYETIAKEISTIPDTVRWYESLYFNVVPYLQQRDWITARVLVPPLVAHLAGFAPTQEVAASIETAAQRQRRLSSVIPVALPFMDASLKYFAYFGGPFMADVMIHGIRSGRPLQSQDDLARWLDETWALTVRRRSLMAAGQVEINRYTAMELMTTHARIMEIEQSDDTQESNRTSLERQVKAFLNDIPWRTAPGKKVDGQADPYADAPGELRDDELGSDVVPEDIWRELPPPRPRQGQPPMSDVQDDFV